MEIGFIERLLHSNEQEPIYIVGLKEDVSELMEELRSTVNRKIIPLSYKQCAVMDGLRLSTAFIYERDSRDYNNAYRILKSAMMTVKSPLLITIPSND